MIIENIADDTLNAFRTTAIDFYLFMFESSDDFNKLWIIIVGAPFGCSRCRLCIYRHASHMAQLVVNNAILFGVDGEIIGPNG